jgi:hypothetical protein
VPDWVNELKQLRYLKTYHIRVTQPITLNLRGSSSVGLKAASCPPLPPATYYGSVHADPVLAPTVGMTVTAWINGKQCGRTQTKDIDGQIVFAIDVLADDFDTAAGCGAPGRKITFHVGSEVLAPSALWNNDQVHEWPLQRVRIYLPLLMKTP